MAFNPSFRFPAEQLSEIAEYASRMLMLRTRLTPIDTEWLLQLARHVPYLTCDEIVPYYQLPDQNIPARKRLQIAKHRAAERLKQLLAAKVIWRDSVRITTEYDLSAPLWTSNSLPLDDFVNFLNAAKKRLIQLPAPQSTSVYRLTTKACPLFRPDLSRYSNLMLFPKLIADESNGLIDASWRALHAKFEQKLWGDHAPKKQWIFMNTFPNNSGTRALIFDAVTNTVRAVLLFHPPHWTSMRSFADEYSEHCRFSARHGIQYEIW